VPGGEGLGLVKSCQNELIAEECYDSRRVEGIDALLNFYVCVEYAEVVVELDLVLDSEAGGDPGGRAVRFGSSRVKVPGDERSQQSRPMMIHFLLGEHGIIDKIH